METLYKGKVMSLFKLVKKISFRLYCAYDYLKCYGYYYIMSYKKKSVYTKLEQLKDKYVGKRVFLIGTGPSLKMDDVRILKKEYTFALNSFVKAIPMIDFEPTFYGFTDVDALNDLWTKEILNLDKSFIFFPSRLGYDYKKKRSLIKKKNSYEYPMLDIGQWGNFAKKIPAGFSENICKNVYFGYTCAYAMMQIIVYMGFKEVYLLGMDCAYMPGICNFMDARKQEDIEQGCKDGDYFLIAWEEVKKFCDKNEITVYNVSEGGKLNIFPRVNIKSIDNV